MDEKRLGASFCPSRGQIRWFLTVLVAFAALVRLMVAYITVHYFDLSFYVDWSTGVANDFFGAYNNIGNLDYPPLFLFPLFLTGKLLGIGAVRAFDPYMMLALKGWQVLFDLACIPLLYRVLRREGQLVGLAGAAIWAVNPAGILNSSYWGQTDSIMIFLVVLAFLLLEEGRPVWSGAVMALACLMKFQSLYFAPVYAVALLTSYPPRRIFRTVAAGAGTVLAVFLPFMARSGWALPLEIYFGGFGQYQGASLNAFNFYSSAGLNYKHFSTKILGLIQADHLSTLLLAAALALLVAVWFTATEKSVWLMGFLFMQTVFMFTTRMHERYQIPVLVMALIAAARHRSRRDVRLVRGAGGHGVPQPVPGIAADFRGRQAGRVDRPLRHGRRRALPCEPAALLRDGLGCAARLLPARPLRLRALLPGDAARTVARVAARTKPAARRALTPCR